jgi:hypothetical protein
MKNTKEKEILGTEIVDVAFIQERMMRSLGRIDNKRETQRGYVRMVHIDTVKGDQMTEVLIGITVREIGIDQGMGVCTPMVSNTKNGEGEHMMMMTEKL